MLFHAIAANLHTWAVNIFWFAFLLGILVLVHEFGHFAVAKLCGVYVETFSIGFGRRLFGFKLGDTDYRISLLPLGGYVKFAGDNPGEAPTGKVGEFNSHPRWQRVLIALAGPVANGILAFGLFIGVESVHHEVPVYMRGAAVIDYVTQNSAAAHAGLHAGDVITSFNNVASPSWEEIFNQVLFNSNDINVPLSVMHDGHPLNTQLHIDAHTTQDKFDFVLCGMVPREQNTPVVVNSLEADSPAEHAGLQPGDQIEQIDALSLHSVSTLLSYLQDQNGAPAQLILLRNGQTLSVPIKPFRAPLSNGELGYRLGFSPVEPPSTVEHLPLNRALSEAWKDTVKNSTLIVEILRGLLTRHVPLQSVSGPIGIFKATSMVSQMKGWWPKFDLTAEISLNLGIFNLLPIPILDGGVIVLLLIESIMRRDVNVEVKERIYQVAFVLLMVIFALVMFNDVSKMNLLQHMKP